MRRIEELVRERCPSGVAFKAIADVARYVRGITYSKNDEQSDGPVCVLRSNNITLTSNTLNFDDVKRVSDRVKVRNDQRLYKNDILISAASGSKAHVGKVAFIAEDLDCVFGGFMAVLRTNGAISPRFLFHLLIGKTFSDYLEGALSTTTINNLNASIMGAFRVPVPPIEVQDEIVRMLDTFSSLEAELQAELEARRKQYTFYRDQLLMFTDRESEIRWAKMGDFSTLVRGNGMPKADFSEHGIGAIHYGQIYTHYGTWATKTKSFVPAEKASKLAKVEPGDIVITNTSENLEDVGKAVAWLGDKQVVTGGHATVIKHDQNPKFLAYYFQTAQFASAKRRHATGTKVIDVSAKSLSQIEIPLPPLDQQERIVSILDKFDALVNDLSSGLPAELNARRQQYEHYRDRLLKFQEAT
jgi:type I restriction enzyme S subunit